MRTAVVGVRERADTPASEDESDAAASGVEEEGGESDTPILTFQRVHLVDTGKGRA